MERELLVGTTPTRDVNIRVFSMSTTGSYFWVKCAFKLESTLDEEELNDVDLIVNC